MAGEIEQQKENIEETIQTLIDALQENQQFYRTAANNAINTKLRDVFRERTAQRGEFAEALAIHSDEVTVNDEGSADGDLLDFLHRGLVTIKAAMTIERDKTDHILIEESLEAEQELLESYDQALEEITNWPAGLETKIRSQYATVKAAYTYIGSTFSAPQRVVLGLFTEIDDAKEVLTQLSAAGIDQENIHVVAQEEVVSGALADNRATMAKEGAGTGALSGGVFGGLLGLIIGASMVITMGPVVVVGIPALAGTTAAGTAIGAIYGSLFGALLGWGVAEDEVHAYIKGIREEQILIAAEIESHQTDETVALFEQHHGTYVAVRQQNFEETQ